MLQAEWNAEQYVLIRDGHDLLPTLCRGRGRKESLALSVEIALLKCGRLLQCPQRSRTVLSLLLKYKIIVCVHI